MSVRRYIFKLVILGPPGVGKSSLSNRFVHNRFSMSYTFTIGLDIMTKRVQFDDRDVRFVIADIGGQDRFSVLRPKFYAGSRGALLVFDLTRRSTLEALVEWKEGLLSQVPNALLRVIGNKSDLGAQREVTSEEAKAFLKEHLGLDEDAYIETSAKTGDLVEDAFLDFAVQFTEQTDSRV